VTESLSNLLNYITGVHTLGDADEEVSVMAGGYVIVSTEETTTIKSQENPEGVVFPRHAVELLVEMLRSHIPSEEEDDDFEEHEAEARLP
jgi:hypothetical protein